MKKIFYLICIVSLWLPEVKAQNCSTDSVVKVLIRDRGDEFANKLLVDTLNLSTGMYHRTIIDLADSSILQNSVQSFKRRYLVLNSNHDTLIYVLMNGTGSGFSNNKSINITYDSITNLMLTRTEYTGSGTNWNLSSDETWTYNGNNLISEYTRTNLSGNVQKIIHTYNGNIRQSILYQRGPGTTWTNDQLFTMIYTAGARDSLILQTWDIGNTAWRDSLSSIYSGIIVPRASFSDTMFSGGTTTVNTYEFDTLDLMRSEYHYFHDTLNTYSHYYYYNYIHNHRVVKQYANIVNGCTSVDRYYYYDQYGAQSGQSSESGCGFGSGSGSGVVYDENYRPLTSQSDSYSSSSDYYHYYTYIYPTLDSIEIYYLSMGFLNRSYVACAGSSMIAKFAGGGGCGPYSYLWTPSTNLSSDTIAQPTIQLTHDTIIYTITISDTSGHIAQSQLTVYPAKVLAISFDTTLCSGCPVVLEAIPTGTSYSWYKDGLYIPGANSSTYTAIESGTYTVEIRNQICTGFAPDVTLTLAGRTRVSGRVFWDKDSDCSYSASDEGLPVMGTQPFLLEVISQNSSTVVIPDSTGYYEASIDTGEFWVKLINPNSMLSANCSPFDSINIYNPTYGNLLSGNDFSLNGDTTCKRLEVTVSSTVFEPCKPSNLSLRYFNSGLTTESNAQIKIKLPNEINLTGATLPYIFLGFNTYTFAIPTLAAGRSGTIDVDVQVVCWPTINNNTICIEAEIDPKDFCSLNPDSTWDGSNIRVSSHCVSNTDVCFVISNEALSPAGHMNSASSWRLFADNAIIQQGTFLLNANSDTTLCFPSAGYTYRLEADQSAGFPSQGYAYSSIERCGSLPTGPSLNKILNHYSESTIPFYYTYCQTIRDNSPSVSKSVQPEGWGPDHYIDIGTEIKYRIDFQNTTADTAHYIEVVDDFNKCYYFNSQAFDMTSLRLLSESHSCQYEFVNNILKYKFYNINLPDSSTDEPGSRGFVEFGIRSKVSTSSSWLINCADVVFDSTSVVSTNVLRNKTCILSYPQISIEADTSFCIGDTLIVPSLSLFYRGTPSYNWYLNGILLSSHDDTLVYSGLNLHDTIQCELISTNPCDFPSPVFSNKIIFNHAPISTPVINFQSPDLVSSSATQFQWYYNQTPIVGATSQNYTPIASGQYQVEVWDSMGCSAISNDFPFINPLVPELRAMQFNVYPNPANDHINIEHIHKAAFSVKVFDNTGREIFVQQSGDKHSVRLQTINLTPGRYILEIVSNEEHFYKPMIILGKN